MSNAPVNDIVRFCILLYDYFYFFGILDNIFFGFDHFICDFFGFGDLSLDNNVVVAGQSVTINTFTITDSNA